MDLTKLTGLWKNKSKKGVDFLAGPLDRSRLEDVLRAAPEVKKFRVMVFRNEYAEGERDPAFTLHLAPDDKPQGKRTEPIRASRENEIPF